MMSKFARCTAAWLVVCLTLTMVFSIMPPALAASGDDTLSAQGCNYPETLEEGKSFSLKGVISSKSSNIARLEAGVYNAKGKMLTGRSFNPKAKSVDLRWYVNAYVKFGTLPAGTYTYKITATNSTSKETLLSQTFTVTPKPAVSDDFSTSGFTYPSSITAGKGFYLRGYVTSASSKITKLTAGVFNAKGEMLTGRTFNPKAKTVDFRWTVNPYVKFGTLAAGTYTYKVTATNDSGTQTLISQEFTVTAAAPVSDTMTVSGMTYPSSVEKGNGFYLRGYVTSQSSKITKLTAGVFDGKGKMLTGRTFNPKAKSVDFRWTVNPYVKFGTLEEGTYTYKVIATNAAGEQTLFSESFTVTPSDKPVVSEKPTASGLTSPTLLIKGRGFALKGVVSSKSSKLTKLTAGVFDGSGKMLTGRSWNPKANSVDFRWYVDSHVKFGSLAIGTYTYKVTATNSAGTETLLETSFEVVE